MGSSLEYTDAKVRQVEEIVRAYPFVEVIIANVGTGEGRNVARVDVRLADRHKVTRAARVKDFENEVREKIQAIPGIELAVGYNRPIWINLLGPNNDELERISNETLAKMAKIKGIVDLESSLKAQQPRDHDQGEQRARERPGPHGAADRLGACARSSPAT